MFDQAEGAGRERFRTPCRWRACAGGLPVPEARTLTDASLLLSSIARTAPLLGARVRLAASRILGVLQWGPARGWWPLWRLLTTGIVLLAFVPVAVNSIATFAPTDAVPDAFRPDDANGAWHPLWVWASGASVVVTVAGAVVVIGVALRLFARARRRLIIEAFVDYTKRDGDANTDPAARTNPDTTKVAGLATLLGTELGSLHELFRRVDTHAFPAAVGVERRGGFGRAKEPGCFLTATGDGLTTALEGAVASDTTVQIGLVKLPLWPLLSLLNQLGRGPRLVGSLHSAGPNGAPTLTAQLVRGRVGGMWRVSAGRVPTTPADEACILDELVRELACRMFTELTFTGSTRWRAVRAFAAYLRQYEQSCRTPRDRGRLLRTAGERLREAVAEDESFGHAHYNLGVVAAKLAEADIAEQTASPWSQPATRTSADEMSDARWQDARVSFWKATETAPGLWQPDYALAVTIFSQVKPPVRVEESLGTRSHSDNVRRECSTRSSAAAITRSSSCTSVGRTRHACATCAAWRLSAWPRPTLTTATTSWRQSGTTVARPPFSCENYAVRSTGPGPNQIRPTTRGSSVHAITRRQRFTTSRSRMPAARCLCADARMPPATLRLLKVTTPACGHA